MKERKFVYLSINQIKAIFIDLDATSIVDHFVLRSPLKSVRWRYRGLQRNPMVDVAIWSEKDLIAFMPCQPKIVPYALFKFVRQWACKFINYLGPLKIAAKNKYLNLSANLPQNQSSQ